MYLLDTNVVSELRKDRRANQNVRAWAEGRPITMFHLSVVSLMELEIGVLRMERRDPAQGARLRQWLDREILPRFTGRILDIDRSVAERSARLHVPDRRSFSDAYIAATAMVHGLVVATRNVADFAPMGVELINPWEAAA